MADSPEMSGEDVIEQEPAEAGATAEEAGPRRPLSWVGEHAVPMVVGLIVVILAGALAVTLSQLNHQNDVSSARTSALAAARTYAVELASYDYRHLDQDFGIVLDHASPAFRQNYSKSSDALKPILAKYDATAKATVIAAGLVSASTGRAVALVFLNQTVTNTAQKGATTDQSRVELTLTRAGGHWVIDAVTLV